ncbi:hypothetical protein [Streptomyces sp. NPDC059575]|uniref:hypothetical protein n=1 Tax=Streptomyces sp. NPDC059575 TaxID=3346872 RepID=UPI0036911724
MSRQAAKRGKGTADPVHLMWMRVTRVRDGRVIEQRREVRVTIDIPPSVYDLSSAWPPCECPEHRNR